MKHLCKTVDREAGYAVISEFPVKYDAAGEGILDLLENDSQNKPFQANNEQNFFSEFQRQWIPGFQVQTIGFPSCTSTGYQVQGKRLK